jgi:hypothetical protein
MHGARRRRGCLAAALQGLLLACGLLGLAAGLSNRFLPAHTPAVDRLSALDKARLAESIHLRQELGEALWPGWGQADIPLIAYNQEYAFLVGCPNPPDGWRKIPDGDARGAAWKVVPDDRLEGQPYYRQRLARDGVTPEAFVVWVGERWVASLTTREWMEIALGNQFRDALPPLAQPLIPYRLAGRLFLSATGGEGGYIALTLHEALHAYAGQSDPRRLAAAETVFHEQKSRYPWQDAGLREDWQSELDLLASAVEAQSDAQALALARQFLAQREKRRARAGLDADLVALEGLKEWEEGLAKYTELTIWRMAASSTTYQPLRAMQAIPGWRGYAGAEQRWAQEVQQMRRMAGEDGDTRFYYTGMGQAALLDRFSPGWRGSALAGGQTLEELLRAAVQ